MVASIDMANLTVMAPRIVGFGLDCIEGVDCVRRATLAPVLTSAVPPTDEPCPGTVASHAAAKGQSRVSNVLRPTAVLPQIEAKVPPQATRQRMRAWGIMGEGRSVAESEQAESWRWHQQQPLSAALTLPSRIDTLTALEFRDTPGGSKTIFLPVLNGERCLCSAALTPPRTRMGALLCPTNVLCRTLLPAQTIAADPRPHASPM